jgi:hypothetical protein
VFLRTGNIIRCINGMMTLQRLKISANFNFLNKILCCVNYWQTYHAGNELKSSFYN